MTAEQPSNTPAPARDSTPDADALRRYRADVSPFVERFAADLTESGMQRMAARVFACLLASEEGALSSADLTARLRASPAAVSGAVRYLSQVHMLSREREPGSRRELYRVRENIWYEALINRGPLLDRWRATILSGLDALGPETAAGRRMKESEEFLAFLQSEMDGLLDRWYAHRAGLAGRSGDGGPAPAR